MKILGFTGSRADYFLQRPLFLSLSACKDIEFQLIVSGGILDETESNTLSYIQNEPFKILACMHIPDLNSTSHLNSISHLLLELPEVISDFSPSICLVYADRYESFAFAQACFHLNKVIMHIEAGDLTYGGTFDDSIRHSISHMAHLYSVTTSSSFKVLQSFGIHPSRIHHTGLLSYDNLSSLELTSARDLLSELNLNPNMPLILATYHPIPRDPERTKFESKNFFQALVSASEFSNIIITSPNHDDGREIILDEIKQITHLPNIVYINSLGAKRYYSLMSYSTSVPVVVAGNSSSIIKEAPFFNAHSLNVGDRQAGRTSASSQVNVCAEHILILKKLEMLCTKSCSAPSNPYFKENPSLNLRDFIINALNTMSHDELISNQLFKSE
tara:strand:+ start:1946 stop:3106 length:1161 start_codon:yes stop_codon:yes gene_type:complete